MGEIKLTKDLIYKITLSLIYGLSKACDELVKELESENDNGRQETLFNQTD